MVIISNLLLQLIFSYLTMILQLVVAAAMTGVSVVAQVPPYGMYSSELREMFRNFAVNIITMEGQIPLLNDPRRQYIEIIHVILTHGVFRAGCVVDDYNNEYYQYLNDSLPESICHTEDVIAKIRMLLDEIQDNTDKVLKLTRACARDGCDEIIQKIIRDQPGKYHYQDLVIVAAGKLAKELNGHQEEFEKVSTDLKASHYLLTSSADLEDIVDSVAVLQKTLHPTYC